MHLKTAEWMLKLQGPVVQSVVSLTSSLRVISLTVLADSIYNILIFFAEKMWVAFAMQCKCKSYSHFFSKKFQHICVSFDVNFNESLTNDIVSFEQLGPDVEPDQMPHSPLYPHNIFLMSLCKPMLWVLIRSALVRHFWWVQHLFSWSNKNKRVMMIL